MYDVEPVPVLLVGAQGQVRSGNPAAATFFQCAPSALERTTLRQMTRNTDEELSRLLASWDPSRSFPPGDLTFGLNGDAGIDCGVEVDVYVAANGATPAYFALRVIAKAAPSSPPAGNKLHTAGSFRGDDELARAILANTSEGAVGADSAGEIVFMNSVAEEITGWKESEARGRSLDALFSAKGLCGSDTPTEDVTSPGNPEHLVSRDGTQRLIARRTAVLPKGDCISLFRDITEEYRAIRDRRRLTEELGQANESLKQLAYSASHDLQEPLRMVAIYSQLLSRKLGGLGLGGEIAEYLSYTIEGARRMESLVRALLSYAEAGADDANIPTEPVDCATALAAALANLEPVITESGAVIGSGPLPVICIRKFHMVQLFENLIGNAVKYRGGQAPRIDIAATPRDTEWEFSVSDNGIGIPEQYHSHVFGLFKRLHTHSAFIGTGIGLAICKRIVEHYHGRIWLASEVGRGSTFYFTLPSDASLSHAEGPTI